MRHEYLKDFVLLSVTNLSDKIIANEDLVFFTTIVVLITAVCRLINELINFKKDKK